MIEYTWIAALALNGAMSSTATLDEQPSLAQTYSWVVMAADGQAVVRSVVEGSRCPSAVVNGKPKPMKLRSKNGPPVGFEGVTVCEYVLPVWADTLTVNNQTLPVPSHAPRNIAFIGDTGCRMKGVDFQNCNNIKGQGDPWLFKAVADAVVAKNPDLIVHVGDYHYRETQCPSGNVGCAGSPWGSNWSSWQADFFQPVANLLPKAPWVYTRGNHEDCNRAWKGWFYMMDPAPLAEDTFASCPDYTEPYTVPFSTFEIAVLDSSTVPHAYAPPPDPASVAQYSAYFNEINTTADASGATWLMTHRPLWALSSYIDSGTTKLSSVDFTLQAALAASDKKALSDNIDMLLAGHLHLYESLSFNDGRPPVIVSGGGGTMLDPPITQSLMEANPSVLQSIGVTAADVTTFDQFSYVMFTPAKLGWNAVIYGLDGKLDSFVVEAP